MPTLVHIENRYCSDEAVKGAAVTIDDDPDAKSPRTNAGGNVYIATEQLTDGKHVLKITPDNTDDRPVGPKVAENLSRGVERTYRSLDVDITVTKGKLTAVSVPAGRQENGTTGAGTNPVRVFLQPIFFHGRGDLTTAGLRGSRKYENISLIVIHQTASASGKTTGEAHGTLSHFRAHGSPHYLVTAEAQPQVIKIVPDNHVAGHAGEFPGQSSWRGKTDVDVFSIGIEDSHKAKTDWSRTQIDRLIRLLKDLREAYPSIPSHGIVGHQDVLLIERDCPGLEFDWVLLEKEGLGMIPRSGSVSIDSNYGGFFRLRPAGQLQRNNQDATRVWGDDKKSWPAPPAGATATGRAVGGVAKVVGQNVGNEIQDLAERVVTTIVTGQLPTTVIGNPIQELQTDLRDIGYTVNVNGKFDDKTAFAVQAFQRHFFAGSRRGLVAEKNFKKVDRVTAEFIKAVRP